MLLLVTLMGFCQPSFAKVRLNIARGQLELGGNIKSIFAFQNLRQTGIFPKDEILFTEQRLRLEAQYSSRYFGFELAEQISGFYQNTNSPFFTIPDLNPRSYWIVSNDLTTGTNHQINHRLDRANIKLNIGKTRWILGKQVVSIGVGHLFQAISQVPRQPFVIVDPEFPITEDAFSLVWDGALALEARLLPKVQGQTLHNFHVRAKGSKSGFDVALTTGVSDDKNFIGLEFAGNLGDSLLRSEVVGYEELGKNYIQGLVGIDRVFSNEWSGEIELFYNGFGAVDNYSFSPNLHRPTPYRGMYYMATRLRWEISPVWILSWLNIVNLNDPSALFHFNLRYSVFQNADLLLGQFVSWGASSRTEFGGELPILGPLAVGLPDMTYFLFRYYF